jgi:hypothetical protein
VQKVKNQWKSYQTHKKGKFRSWKDKEKESLWALYKKRETQNQNLSKNNKLLLINHKIEFQMKIKLIL